MPITLPIVPMDAFAAVFAHVTPSARSFFTGKLCQTAQFSDVGHLHFFKAGVLTVLQAGKADLELHEPTLLFYPRGRTHSFVVDPEARCRPRLRDRRTRGRGRQPDRARDAEGHESARGAVFRSSVGNRVGNL